MSPGRYEQRYEIGNCSSVIASEAKQSPDCDMEIASAYSLAMTFIRTYNYSGMSFRPQGEISEADVAGFLGLRPRNLSHPFGCAEGRELVEG
jgi:hypothetical protein